MSICANSLLISSIFGSRSGYISVDPEHCQVSICEIVQKILDIGAPKPRFWTGSRSDSIGKENGKWSGCWSDLRECASVLIPELQEVMRLFPQIDMMHQMLIKIRSRDTLICERVLGNLTPTPPGVEFWRIKIRIDCAGHRKNEKRTRTRFAGPSLCGVKVQILNKKYGF